MSAKIGIRESKNCTNSKLLLSRNEHGKDRDPKSFQHCSIIGMLPFLDGIAIEDTPMPAH